jgi:glycosyltransferase involved in cell wall biosynthesis
MIDLVSVVMITYAHESFIREAIEGILMQNTTFEVELIIADDNSPDNTSAIVKSFESQSNFHWIKYTKHSKNKGMTPNFIWALEQCKGKYVALCEGDDYWTDPLKLQKQVDFLEENPEYGLVCGGFNCINHLTNERDVFYHNPLIDNTTKGNDITTDSLMEKWNVQVLTATFKTELLDMNGFKKYSFFCDVHLFYLLIMKKKGFYFNEILALQNVHETGVFSHKKYIDKQIFLYNARKDLWLLNKGEKGMQRKVFHATCELFTNCLDSKFKDTLNQRVLLVDMFRTMQDFGDFKHIVKCMINLFGWNSKMIRLFR